MVFCRKSTLLCRQEVRRSMVFSTVQISMPGTSWACPAFANNMNVAQAAMAAIRIRPFMKLLIVKCRSRQFARLKHAPAQIPHSYRIHRLCCCQVIRGNPAGARSEEHTSELQSRRDLVCRLLL